MNNNADNEEFALLKWSDYFDEPATQSCYKDELERTGPAVGLALALSLIIWTGLIGLLLWLT